VAVCDGPQVDDGTAWEIGYACSTLYCLPGLAAWSCQTDRVDGPPASALLLEQRPLKPLPLGRLGEVTMATRSLQHRFTQF
jgi:hypothetical protein